MKSKLFRAFYLYAPNYLLYLINIHRHKRGFLEYKNKEFFIIHIPKSAGTSLYFSLNLSDPGHITFRQAQYYNKGICSQKIVIVIRNPSDRLFSSYKYAQQNVKNKGFTMVQKVGKHNTYSDFLNWIEQSKAPKNHYFFFSIFNYIKYANPQNLIFISFDCLDEGVVELAKKFDSPYKYLSKLNVSNCNSLRTEFELMLERKIINLFYKHDQILYEEINKIPLVCGTDLNYLNFDFRSNDKF